MPKTVSIIVPVYQNAGSLKEIVSRLLVLPSQLPGFKLELLFVDDGSTDGSSQLLMELQAANPSVMRLVKLSKNFGQLPALQAGLNYATGDCVGIVSADLQDPPELFADMIKRWETGVKLVIAEREGREESIRQSFISNAYWRLINKFAVPGYPLGGFDFCLADRQVVDQVNKIAEKNSHVFMLMFSLGYSNSVIRYTRKKRTEGTSQWTLIKKIKLVVDTFVAFSYVPIRAMSVLGGIAALFGFSYTLFAVANKIILGNKYEGWTTIVALISLFGGMTLLMLGIIGEYLWRILDETRKRPSYVVDKVVP